MNSRGLGYASISFLLTDPCGKACYAAVHIIMRKGIPQCLKLHLCMLWSICVAWQSHPSENFWSPTYSYTTLLYPLGCIDHSLATSNDSTIMQQLERSSAISQIEPIGGTFRTRSAGRRRWRRLATLTKVQVLENVGRSSHMLFE